MSKKIKIMRNFSFQEEAQDDPQVKAWFNGSFRAVGSYWTGRTIGTGLTFTEQKLLLPDVLGIEANDKDFRKQVDLFYTEIMTKVPSDGLELEVGLEDDNQPLSEGNLPLNIKDYIIYRHAKLSRQVAENKALAEKMGTAIKQFYIVDPDAVTTESVAVSELEDKAFTLYLNTKDDGIKVDQILTMMGITIRGLEGKEKQLAFKALATKDAKKSSPEQKESLQRFIDLCKDENLPVKFLIQELIGAQVLEKVGQNILLVETGERLGESLREAVLFLNNPKNSKTLNKLKAEYQVKVKREASLAPETIEEGASKSKAKGKEE